MITFAYYILKVILCSGILLGYYWLALRNKKYHQWNRFYLLITVMASLIFPLIKINFANAPASSSNNNIVQLLTVVSQSDEFVLYYSINQQKQLSAINWMQVSQIIYGSVCIILFLLFLNTLVKIIMLLHKNEKQHVNNITIVQTEAKGTPFSFFRLIFWNKAMPLHSESGKKIFLHELTHVKENHSLDKLLLSLVSIVFWCNPFFWLIRKELAMIHEFIADKKATNNDTTALAQLILQTAYPQHHSYLANNFFYSPIKRRLFMLTKNQNPKVSYISRLLVMPLLAILFMAFALRPQKNSVDIKNTKDITVVIDTGSRNYFKKTEFNRKIDRTLGKVNLQQEKFILQAYQDTTKKDQILFTKVDKEAAFPGGDEMWKKYLMKNLDIRIAEKEGFKPGRYKFILQFIVGIDGRISNVTIDTLQNTNFAKHCIRLVEKGPLWQAAMVNGKKVKAYRNQPITIIITDDTQKNTSSTNNVLDQIVTDGKLKYNFGKNYIGNVHFPNPGLSIWCPKGNEVKSITNGFIFNVFSIDSKMTILIKTDSLMFVYSNLSDVNLLKGQAVKAGQALGKAEKEDEKDDFASVDFLVMNGKKVMNPMLYLR